MVNILHSLYGRLLGFDGTGPTANLVVGGGLILNNNTTPTPFNGGTLSNNVTAVNSAATNTSQTLMTYSLPARTLNTNGEGVLVTAFGHFAGNAAPKTLQLNFGGKNINSGSLTQSGSSWTLTARVARTGSNAQSIQFGGQIGTVFLNPTSTTDTSTDTQTIAISVVALDASAASGNIVADGLLVQTF